MRILHVIGSLDPSTGGPPRVAVRLAAGQAMLGHDVTLCSYRLNDPQAFEQMVSRLPSFDRVTRIEVERGNKTEALLARRFRAAVAPAVRKADFVHLHGVWESALRVAGQEAYAAGKPYLLQPNDILNPYSLSQRKLKKSIAMALGYRSLIERSAGLLFGHREECRLVRENNFKTEHFVAGLGGVFEQEVRPLPEAGRFYARFPKLGGHPYVVFLSRLHHKKGLDFLAEGFAVAARRLPDLQLVVIGHDEGAKEDFERRIAAHQLQDRVHLVGPMHGDAKWEAYRDAQCFILPSRDEAYTVAITEALATGLPVVISDACHFDDVAEFGAGHIVELKPEAIGDALVKVVGDPKARARMSDGATRLFRERLCFDNAARETIELYQRAMQTARR